MEVLVVVDAGNPEEVQAALEDPAGQAAIVEEAGKRGVVVQPDSIVVVTEPPAAPWQVRRPRGGVHSAR